MKDSRFSTLIYRIIGKPDRWQDDYLDIMHEILDETDSFDEPESYGELEAGDQILEQIKSNNEALTAFNTLLNKSRFKMIILDDKFTPIYHNQNAENWFKSILNPIDNSQLNPSLARQLKSVPKANQENQNNALLALENCIYESEQVYVRSIQSHIDQSTEPQNFHILMTLDARHKHHELSRDLSAKFGFTKKEELVVLGLIQGKTIREIAAKAFVTENTIKSHLKRIFSKTNTNSQTAVVGTVLTHEAQILDSYFESEIPLPNQSSNANFEAEIQLSDGHTIHYCDYGPKSGRPLIVFHSGYGCRHSVPFNVLDLCKKHNRRIIIPDRPGVGKTPFINGHPLNWNSRLNEFIDALGIQEYDLSGSIISTQMTLQFAAQAKNRINHLILCAPVIINNWKQAKHLTGILNPTARLVKSSRRFARDIYELWLKSVRLNSSKHYRSMLQSSLGSAEKQSFEKDGTLDLLVDVFCEGISPGLEGITHEMVHCISPLKMDLKSLDIPITVWVGTEDKRIALVGIKQILKEELPPHTLHVREGYSEHIWYSLFEEIIA